MHDAHFAGFPAGHIDNMYVTLTNAFRSQYMRHQHCYYCISTYTAKLQSTLLGEVAVDKTEVNFAKGGQVQNHRIAVELSVNFPDTSSTQR